MCLPIFLVGLVCCYYCRCILGTLIPLGLKNVDPKNGYENPFPLCVFRVNVLPFSLKILKKNKDEKANIF